MTEELDSYYKAKSRELFFFSEYTLFCSPEGNVNPVFF